MREAQWRCGVQAVSTRTAYSIMSDEKGLGKLVILEVLLTWPKHKWQRWWHRVGDLCYCIL